jgi:hypothetical protein
MKEKIKNIFKGQVSCVGWMIMFAVLESVALIGVIAYQLKFNEAVQLRFMELFDFLPNSDEMTNIQFSLSITEALMKLANEIVLPTLIVNSVIIIGIFAVKCRVTKTNYVHKLNYRSILRYMLLGSLLNLTISSVISLIPETLMEDYSANVDLVTTGSVLLMVIATGILGPIGEEITFRHFIYEGNKKVGIAYAVIISALSFGIMHGNIIQGTYAFVLGIIFALVDIRENNLLPSIVMHVTINSMSVLVSSLWSNELAGLIAYTCVIAAVNILVNRKENIGLLPKLAEEA